MDCSDDEQIFILLAFESFLFEVGSFLDIHMILICFLLKTGFSNQYMSQSTFFDELAKSKSPFAVKAEWINHYFIDEVFGVEDNPEAIIFRNDWGSLVKSLRDRIAHRDIKPSFDSREKFINDILLNWPTIKRITYHSFAETIGNGIHALFYKALCHIYEVNWDVYSVVN